MRRRRINRDPRDGNPVAIDPASGFKVPLSNLVKQWDGELVDYRFVDKRNPQDFVRGVADNMALPYARPEPPDEYIAGPILHENFVPIILESGAGVVLQEGLVVEL